MSCQIPFELTPDIMPCHDECHEDHDHDIPLESGPQDSLYKVVDTEHVRALNADGGPEKGKVVIK